MNQPAKVEIEEKFTLTHLILTINLDDRISPESVAVLPFHPGDWEWDSSVQGVSSGSWVFIRIGGIQGSLVKYPVPNEYTSDGMEFHCPKKNQCIVKLNARKL